MQNGKANSTTMKVDATDLDHQIAAYEENIARCKKNIIIFTDEIEKQKVLKATLEEELKKIKESAPKVGAN